MFDLEEERIRRAALFDALGDAFSRQSVLTREQLEAFDFGFGPERIIDEGGGIWNPSNYAATLSIIHKEDSKYDDGGHGDGKFKYAYQVPRNARNPTEGKNIKLRRAGELQLPIVMFVWTAPGAYAPVMPVYVIEDEPGALRVILATDGLPSDAAAVESQLERRYAERTVRQRLHQAEFRSKVLRAYRERCAICELQKVPLLDAAHITPDAAIEGAPVVANGVTLCKIHHAAYDANILGITPDYVVGINSAILIEVDGPMLKHGIQEMNGRKLWVPARTSDRPDRERLATRYEEFLQAV